MDGTQRFSDRVADYINYRPGYPSNLPSLILAKTGLPTSATVLDIGCGTGQLARVFLENGQPVVGVEPNKEMREAGAALLKPLGNFSMQAGRAEETGLTGPNFDLAVAGQAFHWFDPLPARREISRMLKPPGWTALIWNVRDEADDFTRDYGELVLDYAREKLKTHLDTTKAQAFLDFFGGDWEEFHLPNSHELDLEGLLGRLRSASYMPRQGQPGYAKLVDAANKLFERYAKEGEISMAYRTRVYLGKLY